MRANIRCSFLALGAVLSLIVLGTPSSAVAEPEGGCPPPFELMTVDDTVDLAPPEFEDDIRTADRNNDDYLCVKFDKNNPGAFTFTDNRRQGGGRP